MKKRVTLWAVVAAMVILAGAAQAGATVVYDWVTHGVGPNDDGFTLNMQWKASDQDYFSGFLVTPDTDAWGNIKASLSIPLVDGSIWSAPIPFFMAMPSPSFAIGQLSPDRKKIVDIFRWDASLNITLPGFVFFNAAGAIMETSATTAQGSLSYEDAFSSFNPPVTGYATSWDQYGEWVLRDGTAPTVPEPGTFCLFAAGVAGMFLWGGRRKCTAVR